MINTLTRKTRHTALRFAIIAATALTGATLVLSASLGDVSQPAPTSAKAEPVAVLEILAAPSQAKPPRQVRVIPLWNVPAEQRGS